MPPEELYSTAVATDDNRNVAKHTDHASITWIKQGNHSFLKLWVDYRFNQASDMPSLA